MIGGPAHSSSRSADLLAVTVIVLSGALVALPVLGGGWMTYLDNPSHLAEIDAAAFEAHNGWSDTAFCGFPVGTLHSPLWYGTLARLVRAGFPAEPLLAACILLGFLAPPLALFRVARRTLPAVAAAALAFLLLVQRTALVGIGSATGGMWTFYLAAGGVILFADRLTRPCRSRRDASLLGVLTALILLTHLFALVPIAILAAIHAGRFLLGRRPVADLVRQAAGMIAGVAAAATYWLPLFLAGEEAAREAQHLAAPMVAARLLLPTHLFSLLENHFPPIDGTLLVGALPMTGLVLLGAAAAVMVFRRTAEDTPFYGAYLAGSILVLLFAAPTFHFVFLGPVSWRLIYFVRVALALASIPLLVRAVNRFPLPANRRTSILIAASLGVAAPALAFACGAPLRAAVPERKSAPVEEVKSLWKWLAEHRREEWGRVYIQDTFTYPTALTPLRESHILSLTARNSGVRQLGPVYGIAPYRTAEWTPSEFGKLYRRIIGGEKGDETLRRLMWLSGATHIVLSDGATRSRLAGSPLFESLHSTGRYEVLHLRNARPSWVTAAAGEGDLTVGRYETGRLSVDLGGMYGGEDLLVRVSYHPGWTIRGSRTASLVSDSSGLLRITGLAPGKGAIELEFIPSRTPRTVAVFGWVALAALFLMPGRIRP